MSTTPQPPPPMPEELAQALATDLAAHREREAILNEVAADPLPGALARAYAGEPTNLHGFTVRPCVGGDIIILRRLNSPLIRRSAEIVEHLRKAATAELPPEATLPPSEFSDEEGVEMVYQFMHPITDVRAALNVSREHFREVALRAVADKVHWKHIPELITLIEASYQASYETNLAYQVKEKAGEQNVNFPKPPAEHVTG